MVLDTIDSSYLGTQYGTWLDLGTSAHQALSNITGRQRMQEITEAFEKHVEMYL